MTTPTIRTAPTMRDAPAGRHPTAVRLSAWAVSSPIGLDGESFRTAVTQRTPGRERLPAIAEGSTDRLSAIALRTAADVLSGHQDGPDWRPERTAIVLGTSTGSLPRLVEMAYDSHTGRRGHDIRPRSISSMVPNAAAGQLAIAHGISGPNTTVAAGRLSGLHALTVAARFLRLGQADRVIAGAVEELSVARLLGDRAVRPRAERLAVPAAEGCVLMLVENGLDASGTAFLGARYGHVGPTLPDFVREIGSLLTLLIEELLEANGVVASEVTQVSRSRAEGEPLREAERDAVARALGGHPDEIVVSELLGDTYSASAAFQVAATLALGRRFSLVTAIDEEGDVAVALLRHDELAPAGS